MSKGVDTPWTLEKTAPYGWVIRAARERHFGAGTLICTLSGFDAQPFAQAIVAAVNAHEDLVAIAKRFLGRMEADDDECTCEPGDPCPLCATRAALEKARTP